MEYGRELYVVLHTKVQFRGGMNESANAIVLWLYGIWTYRMTYVFVFCHIQIIVYLLWTNKHPIAIVVSRELISLSSVLEVLQQVSIELIILQNHDV